MLCQLPCCCGMRGVVLGSAVRRSAHCTCNAASTHVHMATPAMAQAATQSSLKQLHLCIMQTFTMVVPLHQRSSLQAAVTGQCCVWGRSARSHCLLHSCSHTQGAPCRSAQLPFYQNWTFLASPCLHCAQTSLVPEVLVSLQTCLLQHSAAVPPMSDNVVGLLQLAAWCTPTRAGPPRCAAWRTQSEPHMPCCLPVQLSLRPASRLLINEDDQRLRCCSDSQARRCL